MKPRTVCNFRYDGDIWPLVGSWAKDTHLVQEESTTFRRVYRRETLYACPIRFDIVQERSQVTVQAWVKRAKWTSPTWSPLVPQQMELASRGMIAAVPRLLGRRVLNQLLAAVHQPPVT